MRTLDSDTVTGLIQAFERWREAEVEADRRGGVPAGNDAPEPSG